MPEKNPSYLDLLKNAGSGFLSDPTFTVPTGIAAATAGMNYGIKKLGPGIAEKTIPAIGRAATAIGKTASNLNPVLDQALIKGGVLIDKYAPAFSKIDIGKPFANAYNAVAKSPVGKGIATGAKFVGKGVKAVDKALYSGAGGKAHRLVDAAMLGSPTGDPWWEEAQLSKNRQVEGVLNVYSSLSKPGYLDNALKTPAGQREARLALMTLEDSMNKANLPKEVRDHIYASISNPGAIENSDRTSMMSMLNKNIPLRQKFHDPTFQGGGMPSLGDLLTVGTFGANNAVNALSGNAFPALSDKTASGEMGTERFQNYKSGQDISRRQKQLSNLTEYYDNQIRSGKMSKADAQQAFTKSRNSMGLW
jgi:hypothetical protein